MYLFSVEGPRTALQRRSPRCVASRCPLWASKPASRQSRGPSMPVAPHPTSRSAHASPPCACAASTRGVADCLDRAASRIMRTRARTVRPRPSSSWRTSQRNCTAAGLRRSSRPSTFRCCCCLPTLGLPGECASVVRIARVEQCSLRALQPARRRSRLAVATLPGDPVAQIDTLGAHPCCLYLCTA